MAWCVLLPIIMVGVIWARSVPTITVVVLTSATMVAESSSDIGPPRFCDECDGQWVCFDSQGNMVLRHVLGHSNAFKDGYADFRVFDYQGKAQMARGFMDETGRAVLILGAEAVYACSEGMARFEVRANRVPGISYRYGYVSTDGTLAIPPIFSDAGDFSEGLAWVNKGASNWNRGLVTGGAYGYIDKSGAVVIPISFYDVGDFSHGLAPAAMSFGAYGYIDKSGAFVIPPAYETAEEFSDGLARVGRVGGYGFINTKGELVIDYQFHSASRFSEGLAAVGDTSNRTGYIDKQGQLVIPFQDINGFDFSEGLAAVDTTDANGRFIMGYINRSGEFAIEPRFDHAGTFRDGIADVIVADRVSSERPPYIDRHGNGIDPCAEPKNVVAKDLQEAGEGQ